MTSPLRADTFVNYTISGSIPSAVFQYDGVTPIAASTLSGTVQVDQTAGSLNVDIFLSGGISGEYLASSSSPDYSYPNLTDIFAVDYSADPSSSNPANAFPILSLVLAGNPFVSSGVLPIVTEANASLYEDDSNIGYYSASLVGQVEGQFIHLDSGSLTPANTSPVPEPGSLELMSTGLAALGAGLRRLRRI